MAHKPDADDIAAAKELLEDDELSVQDDDEVDGETEQEVEQDEQVLEVTDDTKVEGEEGEEGDAPGDDGAGAEKPAPEQVAATAALTGENPFKVPDDAEAKMKALNDRIAEIEAKWDSGDIGDSDFKKGVAEANREISDLAALVGANKLWEQQRAEAASSAADAQWSKAVADFKTANPDLFTEAHKSRFNHHVKAVTGSDLYAALSFEDQIALAAGFYTQERAALGFPAIEVKRPSKKASQQARQPGKAQQRPPIPPTLGKTPAAMPNVAGAAAFADLDKSSDADSVEEALMRMTEAQREAYLSGTGLE